jgi:hypothetical protein
LAPPPAASLAVKDALAARGQLCRLLPREGASPAPKNAALSLIGALVELVERGREAQPSLS